MQVTRSREECVMMQETAVRENLRDQVQRIDEMLLQAHVFLDDLIGVEPSTVDKVPGPSQPQGVLRELESKLAKVERRARDLTLRLEELFQRV
jgi:hypothetical protein